MYYGNRIRILVVDDEPSICAALRMALARSAYDVVTAHSGEEAQARIMTEHFDAMIVDLRMKDMRGDVVYHIAFGAQPHLRDATLFMTGDITENAELLIAATGCPLMPKPWEHADLLRRVTALTWRVQPATA
jgi:DNA-binding response OmpR family regulator